MPTPYRSDKLITKFFTPHVCKEKKEEKKKKRKFQVLIQHPKSWHLLHSLWINGGRIPKWKISLRMLAVSLLQKYLFNSIVFAYPHHRG